MNSYECLISEATDKGIDVIEKTLTGRLKGLYCDETIIISSKLETTAEKACIISEEIGHYETSSGDIIDMKSVSNRKQERKARLWSYNRLVGLNRIIDAYEYGCRSRYELAEYLDVTEEFIETAIIAYRQHYGQYVIKDDYLIYFEPKLGIFKFT